MLLKASTALAILAAASHAAADLKPYKPEVVRKMSIRDMFGVVRRDDGGYTPTQTYCGEGATCAEACGAGFEVCSSSDDQIHCYDPSAKQTCCPDGTGNSCDNGYYCTTSGSDTYCCPDGTSVADCAAAYGLSGLSSEAPLPSSTSTSSSSSLSSSTSTSATTTKSTTTKSTTTQATTTKSTTTKAAVDTTSHITSKALTATGGATTAASSGNLTVTLSAGPTATQVTTSSGNVMQPAGVAIALFAAVYALVL